MMIAIWIAFLLWIPLTLYVFRTYPARVALLFNFIAGWAVLPSAHFAATTAQFPYWILGVDLPSIHFFTKATVTSIAAVAGILLFDRQALKQFRVSFWDLPMLIWCLVPLLSGFANFQPLLPALSSDLYQILAWGVPYLVGRLYFADTNSQLMAAKAFVIGGLAYVPICLIELFTGPQFYNLFYGYQPYRWIGARRYLGFRPIGFLEDGNQLGIWMAVSALIAICLWRRQSVQRILRLPVAWAAAALFVLTILCQSGGSIILLLCALPFALLRKSYLPRVLTLVLSFAILAAMGLRLANVVSLQNMVKQNAAARSASDFLKKIHRGSFGWRLSQDEKHVGTAMETPLLGSGQWDWWKATSSRPWGLWLLAFGMYGAVGLLALGALQLLPVARALMLPQLDPDTSSFPLQRALAGALLISAIDNLLNGSMILPLCLLIGGLTGFRIPKTRSLPGVKTTVRAPREAAFLSGKRELLR